MPFAEDLSAFLSTDEFATLATLDGAEVRCIFDNGSALAQVGVAGMMSTQPSMTLPTADVPAEVVGLPAVVNGASYLVAEHQPDGTGVSVLLLERSA